MGVFGISKTSQKEQSYPPFNYNYVIITKKIVNKPLATYPV